MFNRFLAVASAAVVLAACDGGEKDKLRTQVDSLRVELEAREQFVKTLTDVGVLMDSIDANRQLLRVNMMEGTSYNDYTSRMRDINNYVKDTQTKIDDLEKALKKSKGNANSYAATIKKLKADLEEKNKEIISLQERVADLGNQNENMKITIDLQEAELSDKEAQIAAKEQELALIEARIQELMVQSKMTEAEAYYARAQAVEEAANRTKLAPRKKKETLKEALELYKKAQSLGNDQAAARIADLEKRVD
ncbi:MAG: hypothetical protein MUC38_05515 [Cyclobacteriaceae bacterium]|jgi:chromosome segregation ATPase|nr:hypothetical protein [Cyclobacteriaceae bacterium]